MRDGLLLAAALDVTDEEILPSLKAYQDEMLERGGKAMKMSRWTLNAGPGEIVEAWKKISHSSKLGNLTIKDYVPSS
jgi:hypothetical protein